MQWASVPGIPSHQERSVLGVERMWEPVRMDWMKPLLQRWASVMGMEAGSMSSVYGKAMALSLGSDRDEQQKQGRYRRRYLEEVSSPDV